MLVLLVPIQRNSFLVAAACDAFNSKYLRYLRYRSALCDEQCRARHAAVSDVAPSTRLVSLAHAGAHSLAPEAPRRRSA